MFYVIDTCGDFVCLLVCPKERTFLLLCENGFFIYECARQDLKSCNELLLFYFHFLEMQLTTCPALGI